MDKNSVVKDDIFFLMEAYREAQKSYTLGEVPVGAVIVKDKKIIGRGFNQRILRNNAIYHGEIVAINDACKNLNSWRLDNTTIYITLEPCLMCMGAIMQARIKRVVFGALDLKGGAFSICSTNLSRFPFKIEYQFIPLNECSLILKDFFKRKRKKKRF